MIKKIRSLLSSEGFQQTLITVVGNTGATGISALSIMITSRLLGPTLFGEFSVGFALSIVITKINDIGLSAALHRFVSTAFSRDEKNAYLSYALRLRSIVALGLFIASLLAAPYLQSVLKLTNQAVLYSSITLGFFISYYDHLIALLQSLHLFTQAVIVNAIQAGAKFLGALFFWAIGSHDLTSMYVWYTAAPAFPLFFIPWLVPSWVRLTNQPLAAAKRAALLEMAGHSAVTHVSNNIVEQVMVIIVQGFLSTYDSGLLGGVYRLALLFSLAAISLGNVLYPRVARYHQKADIQKYLGKAIALSLAGFASFIVLAPLAHFLVVFTIGSAYLAGLPVLYILLGAVCIQLATVPFIALFYSLKQTWYFSVSGVLLLGITILGNVIFLPQYGLVVAGWSQVAARLSIFIFTVGLSIYALKEKKLI